MRAVSIIILLAALILPSGHASGSPPSDISRADLQTLQTQAAQGDAKAQNNLGVLYNFGKGVPRDYTKAAQWYEKAAAQGDASAQANLGLLSALDMYVGQNIVRAYMWFNLAAGNSKGDQQKSAADARDEVARHMTLAQLAEAKRLTQQCQAQQFKGC